MMKGILMAFEGVTKGFSLLQRCVPEPGRMEILVQNMYTTICGSDLHTVNGLRSALSPTVLGHEVVGRIVKIGEGHRGVDYAGNKLSVGDLVSWAVFCSPHHDYFEQQGMPQKTPGVFKYGHALITEQDAFHGGLASHCILKEHTSLLKLPDTIPLPIAATINCAIATAAGALRLAGWVQGKRVLITGMGLLGLTCAAMCKESGATTIIAADINPQRAEHAKGFGAKHVMLFNQRTGKLIETPPQVDLVFDMSGAPDAMAFGLQCLAIGGTAIWIGAVFNSQAVAVDAEQIVRRLLTIKGLHNYNYQDFEQAVRFINKHHHDYSFHQVVGKEFRLEEVSKAFQYATTHKPLRVGINLGHWENDQNEKIV